MTAGRRLWRRLRPGAGAPAPVLPPSPDPAEIMPIAAMERMLDLWTRCLTRSESGKSDSQVTSAGKKAEDELRRFFGQHTLERIQINAGQPEGRQLLLAADRLFVAFLGQRAAMAVTRKIHSSIS